MTTLNSNKKFSLALTRTTRSASTLLLVLGMLVVPSAPANATTTYAVPEGGLSFDANDSVELDRCTAGFGNSLGYADTDEVNGLIATEFLTYRNVANIEGQAIDARVTLTSISGMRAERSASVLDRLDKCDVDSKTRLIEIDFDSVTVTPGEASFVLTIDFLAGGNPATLTNLKMNVEDIDNNQYLEVDNFTSALLAAGRDPENLQEYENGDVIQVGVGQTSTLTTTSTARRFHASGSEDGNGRAETDKHVVEVRYESVSSLVLELGVYEAGGGSFDINFEGFTFLSEPVVINPFAPETSSPAPTATLATTGVAEQIALGIMASMSALLVTSGLFLLHRRRKLG